MKKLDSLNMKNHALKLRDFLLDLFFPLNCIGCGQEGSWLCEQCFAAVDIVHGHSCFCCKAPEQTGKTCVFCQGEIGFERLLAATNYDEKTVARLIKLLKYKFAKSIAPTLSELLVIFWRQNDFSLPSDCLVAAVPLHSKRLRWRGFNQAEEIGRGFAAALGLDFAPGTLRRTKNTLPQVKLDGVKRQANIKDCFEFASTANVIGKTIILIDDVVTTGATVNECARVLKQAGANEVWVLAVARG